jgi:hypothetical protein
MKRRSVLQSIVALPALAAARTTVSEQKQLSSDAATAPPVLDENPLTPVVPPDQTADTVNGTFTPDQLSALTKLGEIIVPPWNGCPGASDAGAAEFLDFLIGCSSASKLDLYRNGLDALNIYSRKKFAGNFAALHTEQADTLLAPLRQAWEAGGADTDTLSAFLPVAKADLLRATFNSRPYIDAVSQTRRPRNASKYYWYPIS